MTLNGSIDSIDLYPPWGLFEIRSLRRVVMTSLPALG